MRISEYVMDYIMWKYVRELTHGEGMDRRLWDDPSWMTAFEMAFMRYYYENVYFTTPYWRQD